MSLSEFTGPKEEEGEYDEDDDGHYGSSYNDGSYGNSFPSRQPDTQIPNAWRNQACLLATQDLLLQNIAAIACSPPEPDLHKTLKPAALVHLSHIRAVVSLDCIGIGAGIPGLLGMNDQEKTSEALSIAQLLQLTNLLFVWAMTQDATFLPPRKQSAYDQRKQQSVLNTAAFPSLDQAVSGTGTGDSAAMSILNALRHMQCGAEPRAALVLFSLAKSH